MKRGRKQNALGAGDCPAACLLWTWAFLGSSASIQEAPVTWVPLKGGPVTCTELVAKYFVCVRIAERVELRDGGCTHTHRDNTIHVCIHTVYKHFTHYTIYTLHTPYTL